MKHLNANLDNVTNVELKDTPTGDIRFLGVDSDGDIVESLLPTSIGGGTLTTESGTRTITEGESFYFDAPRAEYDSACWRAGTNVVLTTTATDHTGISITGTITSAEERLNRTTRTFDTIRIIVENAADTTAFDGSIAGQTAGSYTTVSSGDYTLSVDPCIINTNTGVGFDITSESSSWYDGTYSSRVILASGDVTSDVTTRRNYRWMFWGWDTEPDGSPILHPDTGLPSIQIAESSIRPAERFAATTPGAPENFGGNFVTDNVSGITGTNEIRGGAPYYNQVEDGSSNSALIGYWAENDARGEAFSPGREGSTEISFSNAMGTNRSRNDITYQAGRRRDANPSPGSGRTPTITASTQRAFPFFIIAPASDIVGVTHTVGGVRQGWSPFFSMVSGSGAVRASDGRYYINATPDAPIQPGTPLYDSTNPTQRAVDGIYLNGDYSVQSGRNVHSSWTNRLDRTIYKITRFRTIDPMTDQRWNFVRALDRDETGDADGATSFGADIDGLTITTPDDTPADTGTTITPTNAFSRVTSGSNTAEADEVQDTLTLIAGANITIDIDEGTDAVTISSTDDASVTEITNILDGVVNVTDVSEVVAADAGTHEDIDPGDVAYVTPTELYVNISSATVTVNDVPAMFFEDGPDSSGRQIVPAEWLRIGRDPVSSNAVIDVSGDTLYYIPIGSIAWLSATQQWANVSDFPQILFNPGTASFDDVSIWKMMGDGTADPRTVREHTSVHSVDTSTGEVTITVEQSTHGLPVPTASIGYTVQAFEELATAGDYSMVLPQSTIIRSTGNVELIFPENTINGQVKIEIRA